MCWVLLIIGVSAIGFLGWWVANKLDALTVCYITGVLNAIVFGYLYFEKHKVKN